MVASTKSAGFEGLMARLSEQHERFLADLASEAFAALQAENARLQEDNARLQSAPGSRAPFGEPEPPVLPPLMALGGSTVHVDAIWEPPGSPHHEVMAHASPPRRRSLIRGSDALPGVEQHPSEAESSASLERNSTRKLKGSRKRTSRLDDVDKIQLTREKRRLRNTFRLRAGEDCITQDALFSLLSNRAPTSAAAIASVIQEMKRIYGTLNPDDAWREEQAPTNATTVDAMAELLLTQNLLDFVKSDMLDDFIHVTGALQLQTVDDVVDEATRIANKQAMTTKAAINWESPLNVIVSVTVVVSVMAMGVSLDFDDPNNIGWLVLEALCVAVFISEVLMKMWFWRCEYFSGEAAHWNIADLVITIIASFEFIMTVAQLTGQIASASRIVVMARLLRCARVVRLMKLLHSPILRDLANMLVGFIIGIPALLWTLLLLILTIYMLGIIFRQALGPSPGQNLTATCGYGDDMTDFFDEECKVHYLYGEEFFGTVGSAMFTSFRFMLGDYSSRGGKSLVVALSQGYGKRFEFVFVLWMVLVIFGLFNIITAIFVDSTISGLKHNDVKRKYARQYECSYVKGKLKQLVARLHILHETRRGYQATDLFSSRLSRVGNVAAVEMELDEDEFVEVMSDEVVASLLGDLDVAMFHPAALFDAFDPDGNGKVSLNEMVQAILKLRGEPQKGDMIANFVSLRSLHEKVDTFAVFMKECLADEKELRASGIRSSEHWKEHVKSLRG